MKRCKSAQNRRGLVVLGPLFAAYPLSKDRVAQLRSLVVVSPHGQEADETQEGGPYCHASR
jgi:hypothetical protein